MKHLAILCIFYATGTMGSEKTESQNFVTKPPVGVLAKQALDEDKLTLFERRKAFEAAIHDYQSMRRVIIEKLASEPRNRTVMVDYISPLHCALLMTDSWRITEAENHLIELITVQLDPGRPCQREW